VPQWVAMLNTRVFVLPLRAGGVLHHGRELGGLFSHRLSRRSWSITMPTPKSISMTTMAVSTC